MIRPTIVAVFCLCLLFQATHGVAQDARRPQGHFGTFNKPARLGDCVSYAERTMTDRHYQIWERTPYVRIGGDERVIVEVVCVPTGNGPLSVTVSAFSSDSQTAERARNEVREYIVRAHRIDD